MKKSTKILGVIVTIIVIGFIGYKFFHRIPVRITPQGAEIVSPANGRVIAIETIPDNEITFLKGETLNSLRLEKMTGPLSVIVIEMNVHNVHVQRAPIDGKIISQIHTAGAFKNAIFSKDKVHLENTNEKTLTVFENKDGTRIGVIQVAGFLARRIESWSEVGASLNKGEPYGIIKLGSQVVVVMSADIEPLVEINQVVIDGETILGNFP